MRTLRADVRGDGSRVAQRQGGGAAHLNAQCLTSCLYSCRFSCLLRRSSIGFRSSSLLALEFFRLRGLLGGSSGLIRSSLLTHVFLGCLWL